MSDKEETREESRPAAGNAWQWAMGGVRRSVAWLWRHASATLTVAAIAGAFLLGLTSGDEGCDHPTAEAAVAPPEATVYSCSMHPQIRQDGPGICPICNMELVPVKAGSGATGEREISLSAAARRLAELATSRVERKAVAVEVRMVGKVDYDETRVRTIAAWLDGRIERLHANFTGQEVGAGDPLVDLYSPRLFVAQKELLLARDAASATGSGAMQEALLEAAREKLRLWGLSADQIRALEAAGEPSETLTIPAPIGGTVVHKPAREGMYVREGTPLLTVADLAAVWVQLDAFESDLSWLRVGQAVSLTTEAWPGVVLEGTIRFIEPFVDPQTRTAAVRVEVPNRSRLLKPEMFVRAVVQVPVAELKGGYLPSETGEPPPLVVPHTAVLRTGRRAVVYVEKEGAEDPTYEGRTVQLGPRAGDFFIVRSGVEEGEQVVTHGAFKLDAALQILAKPSMMSLPSEENEAGIPPAFRTSLAPVYAAYFQVWKGLKEDDPAAAAAGYRTLHAALPEVQSGLLPTSSRTEWERLSALLMENAMAALKAEDLALQRKHFEPVSEAALALQRTFGHAGEKKHFEMYCPMAFDNRGAPWLQETQELLNPYFGAGMLRCGVTRETFAPDGPGAAPAPAAAPVNPSSGHHH
jgi:Cu(I)/Ag(I) efflux system membrane fusion protein